MTSMTWSANESLAQVACPKACQAGVPGRADHPVGKTRLYIVYLWLTFNLLDLITTHVGLQGGNGELNPIYRRLMGQFGLLPALGVKMALVLITIALIALLGRRWGKAWQVLRTANMVVCIAVFWNLALVGV